MKRAHPGIAMLIAGVSLAAALALPRVARAQPELDEERARTLFEEGMAAAEAGDYDTAIPKLEASYRLYPHPGTLMNLAIFLDRAERPADAFHAWTELLERYGGVVSAEARERAQGRIDALSQTLATLTVTVNRPGAVVLVDGQEVGRSPLPEPLRLAEGSHAVVARLSGFPDAEAHPELAAGAASTVRLVLAAEPPPEEVHAGPALVGLTPSGGTREPASLGPVTAITASPDKERQFWKGPWPWILGGVLAAAVGALAIGLAVRSEGLRPDWTLQVY